MWYFAYGSNLNSQAVAEWCRHYGYRVPTLKPGRSAVLDNYRLGFPVFSEYWGGGIADIVYDPGKYVAGVLFDLTEAEIKTLDAKVNRKLEGDKEVGLYKRIEVRVAPAGQRGTGESHHLHRREHREISHSADAALHGFDHPGGVRVRAVDDVDIVLAELQHAGGKKAQAAGDGGCGAAVVMSRGFPFCRARFGGRISDDSQRHRSIGRIG